jgi:hypothetical protein
MVLSVPFNPALPASRDDAYLRALAGDDANQRAFAASIVELDQAA